MGKNHIYCPADLNFPKKALQAMQGGGQSVMSFTLFFLLGFATLA